MENKYIIKFSTKAEKHIKSVIKSTQKDKKPYKGIIKGINQSTKCHSCKKRRAYRQFYYDGKVTSVCEICLYSRDPKTVDMIYSGQPVQLQELDISDTNVLMITNFYMVVFRTYYGSIIIHENGKKIFLYVWWN